jgi:hypothetical protein
MANNFKNAGASGVSTSSGSPTTIYTSNNGTAAVNSILIELDVANTGTSAVAASVLLYDTSATTSYHIVKDAPIPAGSTMKVVSGQKIVLNDDDEIRVYATAATVDVVASILEDVN